MTLLQIVNRTLSAINSTQVSDVTDTAESNRVVDLVHYVLEDIYARYPWLHKKSTGSLDAGSDTNDLSVPSDVAGIEWIYYTGATSPLRKPVKYVEPDFFEKLILDRLNSGDSNVDANGALDDTDPKYWTTFDQSTILFDAYDTALDNTKTTCFFIKIPTLPTVAANTPDIPVQHHIVVLQGVLAHAFRTLKGDDAAGDRYMREYMRGLTSMKAFGPVVQIPKNARQPIWLNDYGRKFVGSYDRIENKIFVQH